MDLFLKLFQNPSPFTSLFMEMEWQQQKQNLCFFSLSLSLFDDKIDAKITMHIYNLHTFIFQRCAYSQLRATCMCVCAFELFVSMPWLS